jgi:hypothetical protein
MTLGLQTHIERSAGYRCVQSLFYLLIAIIYYMQKETV